MGSHDVPDDLTESERRLWDGFPGGQTVDLSTGDPALDDLAVAETWGPERIVRARVITALLLGAREGEPDRTAAVRLTGARIEGVIDLDYAQTEHHLRLKDCFITNRFYAYGARMRQLSLVGSRLDDGLDASLSTIDGNLRLLGCRITGETKLAGAHITGALRLDGAHLSHPGETALNAHRLRLDDDFAAVDGFSADGEVRLDGAHIGGDLLLDGASLRTSGMVALKAARIEVDNDVSALAMTALGGVGLRASRIAGQVKLSGAHLSAAGGEALDMRGAQVAESLYCDQGFSAEGPVRLDDARIGRDVRFESATLSFPQDSALLARGTEIGGGMHCSNGFTADGALRLNGAQVGGILSFHGADVTTTRGFTVTLTRATARELDLRTNRVPAQLDLSGATIGVLNDVPGLWPTVMRIEGLRVDQFKTPGTAAQRVSWLQRDDRGSYVPQPYEQLAELYRRLGHDDEARVVLLAKQRARRRTLSYSSRLWGTVQDATVGYGYQPQRALGWMLLLLVAGTTVFGLHHPEPLGSGPYPPYNPLIFTLDLLLPVIGFGQAHDYAAQGAYQWLAYSLVAAGWLLTAAVATGLARIVNRG
jgi:hypothetical protein